MFIFTICLINHQKVQAAEKLEPLIISTPADVDTCITQDLGMIGQFEDNAPLHHYDSYYFELNISERGYFIYRGLASFKQPSATTNSAKLWSNSSATMNVKGTDLSNLKPGIYYIYYLDPGTYYFEIRSGQAIVTAYSYFLPVSKNLSIDISSNNGSAFLDVNTSIPNAVIDWVKAESKTTDINDSKFYTTKELTDTIKVTEKGTYSIRITSTDRDWEKFPLDIVVTVDNIKPAISVNKVSKISLKPQKKSITVNWKKVSGASGYQIQISASNTFSSAKMINISKTKTSKKMGSLKSKKKYYIRVRAYKKIGSKTIYGVWNTKNKTTK